jgi:hypothetical protein
MTGTHIFCYKCHNTFIIRFDLISVSTCLFEIQVHLAQHGLQCNEKMARLQLHRAMRIELETPVYHVPGGKAPVRVVNLGLMGRYLDGLEGRMDQAGNANEVGEDNARERADGVAKREMKMFRTSARRRAEGRV